MAHICVLSLDYHWGSGAPRGSPSLGVGGGGVGVDGWQQISCKGHTRQVRIGSHVPANNVRGMVQIIFY